MTVLQLLAQVSDGSLSEYGMVETGSFEARIQEVRQELVEAKKIIFELSSELVSVRGETFGKCMIGENYPLGHSNTVTQHSDNMTPPSGQPPPGHPRERAHW